MVSIIVRSIGRATLREALDSVAAQRYLRLELVVVNAAGASHPVLSDHHGRIPVRVYGGDGPLARSRAANLGMENAAGDYLLFLDDDDWLLPDHIGALVSALWRQPNLRAAYAGVECIREESDGTRRTVLVYNEPYDALRLLYENYIPIHALMFDRHFFSQGCRFDEGLDLYEDWDFWLQLRRFGPFAHVEQVSALYRLNAAQGLGSAAQKGLQIPAWDHLLRKWRGEWTDQELREVCVRAKRARSLAEDLAGVTARLELAGHLAEVDSRLEAERQARQELLEHSAEVESRLEAGRQARQELAEHSAEVESRLEAERQARQELAEHFAEVESRHRDTLASWQERLEATAARLARSEQALEAVSGGLAAIESSRIWRASAPYRRAMVWLRGLRAMPQPGPATVNHRCSPNPNPIDVIIPVYAGLAETQACIRSVLETVPPQLGDIVVIDDASPEPELVAWLEQMVREHPRIRLLHNAENLGFVKTCNRGMALDPERDLVLLNSDAEVANDWLARLRECAYRDRRIGTVTPFSNNATICSYPRFCKDNALPPGWSVADLDALFSRCNRGRMVNLPTAIGFCMYIRRDCLTETGAFDERHFGKGYGEENDFSMRAQALGWRDVLCGEVFVYHAGSVSFADHQNLKRQRAMEVLNRLHPGYEPAVHRHIALDPIRPLRLRADLARLAESPLPRVLLVTHDRAGGTQRHVEELAELFRGRLQFLLLRPAASGSHQLSWLSRGEAMELLFELPRDADELVACLRTLGVQRVHFHHTLAVHPAVFGLPQYLGVPYDFSVHDYYACCPQISLTTYRNRYCGEPDEAGCARCLAVLPAPGGGIRDWRERYRAFLSDAERILAPSRDAAQRFSRYFPEANIRYAPHPESLSAPDPCPSPLARADEPLRIAVLGALSPIKGADLLEDCAADAYRRGLPLRFELFGYAYRDLHRPPRDYLRVDGPYRDADLPDLLTGARPHLLWFPALWPETYSYTLSACLQLGLPAVVPDLGAFAERVAGRPWTWVRPWDQPGEAWNDFFTEVREQHFATGLGPLPPLAEQAAMQPFDYAREYWVANEAAPPPATGSERELVLAQAAEDFAFLRLSAAARRRAGVRLALLDVVTRLRGMPVLRGVARRIPLGWQTRVKTWLRGSTL